MKFFMTLLFLFVLMTGAFAQVPDTTQQLVTDWTMLNGSIGHVGRSITKLLDELDSLKKENEKLKAALNDVNKAK